MNYQSSGKTGKGYLCFPYKLFLLLFCVFSMSCNRESGVEPLSDETNSDVIQLGASVNLQTRAMEVEENVIVRMTTTWTNPKFMIATTGDIEVDWGDGTREKGEYKHTYTDGKDSHEIVFRGSDKVLISLNVYNIGLTSLDVSKNTALTELWCHANQLRSLEISNNTALIKLSCGTNQLTSLDVSENTALTELDCYFNQLTSLDVSQNTALTELWCSENPLTSLGVSQNTKLKSLNCWDNQLTTLDVSQNTALTELSCGNNQLDSLDVSQNTALTELDCVNNQLTSLEVSQNKELKLLFCYENPFVSDVNELTAMANSLPDRTEKDRGALMLRDLTAQTGIQNICDAKNWRID